MNLKPLSELNNRISVDEETGQIYMSEPVLSLRHPVLVVRHGQTDGNLRHVLQGQIDGDENQLNKKGIEQAKLTAEKLLAELQKHISFEIFGKLIQSKRLILLTSPITRAKDTAGYFIDLLNSQNNHQLSLLEEPLLKEIFFGKYDGCSLQEIPELIYANQVKRYRKFQDATIDWTGTGERFIDVLLRAKKFIETINSNSITSLYICFSHGTIISAIRTVLGDERLLSESGMILFREKIIENAEPHWLASSESLIQEL